MSATAQPGSGGVRCPRCGVPLAAGQDWCLQCGTAARTVVAPTPNWRAPIALIGVIVALSGAALAFAFVTLTGDDEPVVATTPMTATTSTVAVTAAPEATAPADAATTPGAVPPATTAPEAPAAPQQTAPVATTGVPVQTAP